MAKLNNLYIFVETEDISHNIEVTSHAVEQGADLTDHIRKSGDVLSLKGRIVGKNYDKTLKSILNMQSNGTLIKYVGTETFSNMVITSFSRGKANTVYGGCTFDMELTQIRVAKSPYNAKKAKKLAQSKTKAKSKASTKQVKKKSTTTYVYHTVKKGDTVWALVNGPYKSLGSTCKQIMNWNPHAFSRKGDFGTLQIGKKLKMGVRK